ncbi:protein of unknown function DUF1501 [Solidesulfovibrio fructosivorans JJ]]|uniref:DUF1501 domain-containing protein n=1 Tax=Solidesulfovibrio fructosivorans JJ] TaxID=596151 RepID=E1K095_SOLFR|nr:DUF1501 domain-containing protein [Solidesulfovibrio fructosivorans]EFL49926.1 protein of unknown function DUF1501 [Solidesulfovibrio fructosivorans JJ]]
MRRREALRFLAMLGAAGLACPTGIFAARGKKGRGAKKKAQPVWRAGKQLVVLLLQGGPDGLSVVAPTGDPLYRYLRPTLALPADCGGLDLGDGFLLHPALADVAPFFGQKKLALIPACGLPGVRPQHAAAVAAFARGTAAGGSGRTGWLGRLAVALGGGKGQMLVACRGDVYDGAPHYNMIAPGRGPRLPGLPVEDQTLFDAAGQLFSGKEPLAKAFAAGRNERREVLAKLLAEARRAAAGAIPAPAFPDFAERFGRELARRRDAALAYLAIGGFDTHSCQGVAKGYLADRLRETGQGLANMVKALGRHADDTVIVALGEFGRTARENGFGGTDNGQGGVMLALGGPVAGGRLYGDWPGLAGHRLAGGHDIPVATDWRDVIAGIAVRHLGLPESRLGDVFPGYKLAKDGPKIVA